MTLFPLWRYFEHSKVTSVCKHFTSHKIKLRAKVNFYLFEFGGNLQMKLRNNESYCNGLMHLQPSSSHLPPGINLQVENTSSPVHMHIHGNYKQVKREAD